jgi:hypothetical protein
LLVVRAVSWALSRAEVRSNVRNGLSKSGSLLPE